MRMETLRWKLADDEPAPHELRVCEQNGGSSKLLLLLEKEDPEPFELDLDGVTVDAFLSVWNTQGGWLEEGLWKEGDRFFVIRYVRVRFQQFVVWRCDHRNNRSFDRLSTFSGTLSEMTVFYARKA